VIDFHCHIDLFPNPQGLIKEIDAAGIYVLAVTTTPKSWRHLQVLLKDSKRIRTAIGLHPELIASRAKEVDEVCTIMPETRYVGEIGIDGSPEFKQSFRLQQEVFERILKRASDLGGKIISIHSRRAAGNVLEALSKEPKCGTPVLHWFSGSKKELERAIELNCWFSVGPVMLESKKGKELVSQMPKNRILTESDGPFAQLASQPVTPSTMKIAEQALATIWETTPTIAAEQVAANFKRLVS